MSGVTNFVNSVGALMKKFYIYADSTEIETVSLDGSIYFQISKSL